MDVNHEGGRVRSDGYWPSVTSCVRILLVDENPASLVHTASLLQEQLYNVTTAGSAAMALKFFEARKGFYDIVMADFHMQDMDILNFMQSISDKCLTSIPIILMAEDDPMDFGKEALVKGASFCLQKPPIPRDIAKLWQQIAGMTGRIPGATSTKQKKRALINSDDENRNRRKSRNAQGRASPAEARPNKTSNMRNEHCHYQAPSHLQKKSDQKGHPSISLVTPPTTKFGCYTLEGVQQKLIQFLDGRTENIIMNTESSQVPLGNGGQVTLTNSNAIGALHVPNQNASGDLGREIYCNENIIINTGSNEVAEEIARAQLSMKGGQVTSANGHVTGALQVPNQNAPGDLGREIYYNEKVIMKNGSSQVAEENAGAQIFMEVDHGSPTNGYVTGAIQVPYQEASGDLTTGIYHNENVMVNAGSSHVAGEIGGAQIFMEVGQVIPTNGFVTRAIQVPYQEPSGDLATEIYGDGNIIMNTGSGQVAGEIGGAQISMEGGQVTPTNGYVSGALQVPNQEVSGYLGREIYSNENTGNLGNKNTGHGTATSPNDTAEEQLTDDDIAKLLRDIYEEDWNLTVEANSTIQHHAIGQGS